MKKIRQTQDAYINQLCNEEAKYYASAVGINRLGNIVEDDEYTIVWDITDADTDDESNACDWDCYDVYQNGKYIGDETTIVNIYLGV